MSRNNKTSQASAEPRAPQSHQAPRSGGLGRRGIVVASGVALLLAGAAGALVYKGARSSSAAAAAQRPGLASAHAPTLGDALAKVHIVEFLDPACETCAAFYPLIKQIMADNPNRIRLSIRHVPFHQGSEDVVRFLEASRKQGKYWQTLETLLSTQAQWAPHHTAQPGLARQAIAGIGLNLEQLAADMHAPEVTQRIQQDIGDAAALNVTKTPEYFVNGRQMQSFGRQQLQNLVRETLQSVY